MLTHHRRPVSLTWLSTDLPLLTNLDTLGIVYQKDRYWFHLMLKQPLLPEQDAQENHLDRETQQLLWLEISPYRVIMTQQGTGKIAYRHFWEEGVFGSSHFWFNGLMSDEGTAFRLRNFTRRLTLKGQTFPEYLRIEYELWTPNLQLGHYALHLEIHH